MRCVVVSILWLSAALFVFCAEPDYYSKLLSASAKIYGKVEKQGHLPLTKWSKEHVQLEAFSEWLLNGTVFNMPVAKIPPLSFRCAIYVNHPYKFIFVRNRKAASTSIVEALGSPCYEKRATRPMCMDVMVMEQFTEQGLTPQQGWKDYFVFAVARNPWARAASGYDYLTDTMRKKSRGVCRLPTFEEFCRDPMILGKQHMVFRCSQQNAAYNFFHVEPAARCMLTDDGKSTVDFLIRYEHLEEDFNEVVKIINERRPKALAPLKPRSLDWRKKGVAAEDSGKKVATDGSEQHADKFRKCGDSCVKLIEEFFVEDMKLFGFDSKDIKA